MSLLVVERSLPGLPRAVFSSEVGVVVWRVVFL